MVQQVCAIFVYFGTIIFGHTVDMLRNCVADLPTSYDYIMSPFYYATVLPLTQAALDLKINESNPGNL